MPDHLPEITDWQTDVRNEWMTARMHGCKNARMHKCANAWMHECTNQLIQECKQEHVKNTGMNEWMHKCMNAWMVYGIIVHECMNVSKSTARMQECMNWMTDWMTDYWLTDWLTDGLIVFRSEGLPSFLPGSASLKDGLTNSLMDRLVN